MPKLYAWLAAAAGFIAMVIGIRQSGKAAGKAEAKVAQQTKELIQKDKELDLHAENRIDKERIARMSDNDVSDQLHKHGYYRDEL